ncbi:Exportin-T [Sciurus carolinensis]|uniref:Exportin-T n=1 Tax=Sciurus carolinensis TaxID=30640 RepID=A0AA41N8K6_SCICA|nr:Exportin-T [Sciurus carolinensis]
MDEQALLGLNPNADSDFRRRALAYFEQLKISPDAWQVCAEAPAQRTYSDDHIKFFCFLVLEHQVKYKHSELTTVQQQLIKETLISWLQVQMLNPQPEKTFIQNKAAQVFALLFVTEYLTKWSNIFLFVVFFFILFFVFYILSVIDLNPRGVDLYLQILMVIDSETSKAFTNKETVKQCGCSEVYLDYLQSFLPIRKDVLRSGVHTFLHRMIICLEEEVPPFTPSASEHMLKDSEAKDLQELIPLIKQITAKIKMQVSPFLQQMFMPLLHAIFKVLLRPAEENDQSAALEKQMLQRSYLAFLQTVAGSRMSKVRANQGAENVERVLITIIQGAVEYTDPTAQNTCFIILSKLVELWGGKDGPVGFSDFVYKHTVSACFLAPLKQTFNLDDAQTVLALSECAVKLKTIHLKWGPECVQYLQQEYLPSLQVAPEIIQESSTPAARC